MSFQLIDSGWDAVIDKAVAARHGELRVICPFIKRSVAERLLQRGAPRLLRVITRFNLDDMSDGVSDISALRLLCDHGAHIRGIKNLHAKLYLFGQQLAIVTSANLTEAALVRNHEFGFVASEHTIIRRCQKYFDDLWSAGRTDLTEVRLATWEEKLKRAAASNRQRRSKAGLGDEGMEANFSPFAESSGTPVPQGLNAFVKFFGTTGKRLPLNSDVFAEVDRTGSHWACTYPKRPNQVRDGDILFLARMTCDPSDIIVFGRAIGCRHVPKRDEASQQDIRRREFKKTWPYYIRVHGAEFVAGTLENGVSLNRLMNELDSDSFAATQQNVARGAGNSNPRRAYLRQPQVKLAREGFEWMHHQLEIAFAEHGKLSSADLERLDWPTPKVTG